MSFDERYKVYLDVTVDGTEDNWFQCYPDISEFKRTPFSDEMFTRQSFGKVTFTNNPKLYTDTSLDAYRTYNLINEAEISQEIRIKITISTDLVDPDTSNEIIGYFGANDCEFDDDKKIVTVTPTILDQYTDLVENWDTEVNVFGAFETRSAKWVIDSLYIGDVFTASHSIPVIKVSSDIDEARDSDAGTSGISGAILSYATKEYDATITMVIDAEVINIFTIQRIDFKIRVYDGSDSLQQVILLGEGAYGHLASTYSADVTVPLGHYVKVVAILESNESIEYNNVVINVGYSAEPYSTSQVDANIQATYLQHYDIWTDVLHGRNAGIEKTEFETEIPTLDSYFNANGSPKDELLTENSFAPESTRQDITLWTENGYETVPLIGLYVTGMETALEGAGFELSDITVYTTEYKPNWLFPKMKIRTRALCRFSRFESWEKNDGSTPVGSGWTDTGQIDGDVRLWIKKPFDGSITTWTKGSIDTNGGSNSGFEWDESLNSSKLKNYPSSDESVTLSGRSLYDIIKTVYNGTHASLVNYDVESTFFWNDTDSLITVATGINYFTGQENFLNNIIGAHTYQLQDVNVDSDDATLALTFKDFMADLKALFNNQIFWWIEADTGTLKIEHLKYIDIAKEVLDVVTPRDSELDPKTPYDKNIQLLSEISSWSYEKSEMFSIIDFKIANAGYKDFTENIITYEKIVSNKRNEDIRATISTKKTTTDIRYCIENPSDIENGVILLNYDSDNEVAVANVPVANVSFENGNLALSTLLNRYKYEGVFLEGTINGNDVEFDITSRTKVGKEFLLKGIYDYDYFKSKLGIGRIESIEHNLEEETTRVSLKYRFGSDANTDTFILMVSEIGDFTGAVDTQFDFG
jgi:hypothetical protein